MRKHLKEKTKMRLRTIETVGNKIGLKTIETE